MRTRRLTAVCMTALLTLTAATGAYALACSQCHESYQGGRHSATYGHGHHYRQARGCCHGAWSNGGGCAPARCAYAHEASRGYHCDGSHACYHGYGIKDADPKTFTDLGGGYAKDSRRAYYAGRAIAGADAKTFRHIGRGVAKDKRNTYIDGRKTD